MTKNYYKTEYSRNDWKSICDQCEEMHITCTYSKYGDIMTVDTTWQEDLLLANVEKRGGHGDRLEIAERLNDIIVMNVKGEPVEKPDTTEAVRKCREIESASYLAKVHYHYGHIEKTMEKVERIAKAAEKLHELIEK